MSTFVIYNSVNANSNKIGNEAFQSFSQYEGWDPVLWDGCTPHMLPWYRDKYEITAGNRTKKYANEKIRQNKESCFFSHYSVWELCANNNETAIIVEHDTICNQDFILPDLDWDTALGVQLTTQSMLQHLHHYNKYQKQLNSKGDGIHQVFYTHTYGMTTFAGGTGYMLSAKACQWLVEDCRKNGWCQNDMLFTDQDFPLYYVYPSPVEYIRSKELKSSSRGW